MGGMGALGSILLVEDDFLTALAEKISLESCGYRVLPASSGQEAVDLFRSDPGIDLVLMDIDLGPGIDGIEAATIMLMDRELPIIFLSSHSEPEIVERTETVTSYGYIVKSSGTAVIDASIKMAFRLHEAQKGLWAEKEHLRATLNSIGDAVIATDISGNVTRMNPVAQRLTGWDFAGAEGRPIEDIFAIVNAQTGAPVENPVPRVLESGAMVGLANHTVLLSRTGREYQIADSAAPIFDDAGRSSGVVLVFRDVTEEYGMLEALRRSEDLYRSLFSHMLNGLAYCRMDFDADGRPLDFTYLSVNAAFESQTGLHDVEGKRVTQVIPGIREQDDGLFDLYGRVSKGGKPERVEYFVESLGMWFEVSAYCPVHGFFVAVFDVISKRKEAEQSQAESEERLRLALKAAKAGTWEWDLRTNANTWSDELWDLYGLSCRSAEPSYEAWLSSVAPEDRERVVDALNEAVRSGTELNIEWRVAGAEDRWLMSRGQPKLDSSGRVRRYIGVAIEITDRKRAEVQVRGLLAEKELILREVHHRVKNNMSTICNFLGLQAESARETFAKRALLDAGSRAQSMLILYDKLYQTGQFERMSLRMYLPTLIDQIIANFENREGVSVEKRIDDIVLDAKRLQSIGVILNELLTNIMKYAFAGRGKGEIRVAASQADGMVVIVVQDNGVGMPEGISFDRSDGFGLMLIDGLTRQIDGEICLERVGGTRVILKFPG
jgi:PAS domain S-box-containing protein